MWFIWLRPLLISFLTYRSLLILICSNHFFSVNLFSLIDDSNFFWICLTLEFYYSMYSPRFVIEQVQWRFGIEMNTHAGSRYNLMNPQKFINLGRTLRETSENPPEEPSKNPRRTLSLFFFFNPIEPDNVPKVNSLQLCH